LPKDLKKKCCIVNVKNQDQKCFLWSILAALHPNYENPSLVTNYQPFENTLDMGDIQYPVKLDKVAKFEKQNSISVNVFGWNNELFPLYITTQRQDFHVNLLLFSEGEIQHFSLIHDLNRLLYQQNKHKARMYYCNYCLHGFVKEDTLHSHIPYCCQHGPQKIEMPSEDDKWLFFKDISKQHRDPFVIYADFESFTVGISQSPSSDKTVKYQEHVPSGFCYLVHCSVDDYSQQPIIYRGPNVAKEFIHRIQAEEKRIKDIYANPMPVNMTDEDWKRYGKESICHICEKPLGDDKVLDHCHISGKFRGAAHSNCNLQFKLPPFIPVVFHNL
jgi:hypothetical protein